MDDMLSSDTDVSSSSLESYLSCPDDIDQTTIAPVSVAISSSVEQLRLASPVGGFSDSVRNTVGGASAGTFSAMWGLVSGGANPSGIWKDDACSAVEEMKKDTASSVEGLKSESAIGGLTVGSFDGSVERVRENPPKSAGQFRARTPIPERRQRGNPPNPSAAFTETTRTHSPVGKCRNTTPSPVGRLKESTPNPSFQGDTLSTDTDRSSGLTKHTPCSGSGSREDCAGGLKAGLKAGSKDSIPIPGGGIPASAKKVTPEDLEQEKLLNSAAKNLSMLSDKLKFFVKETALRGKSVEQKLNTVESNKAEVEKALNEHVKYLHSLLDYYHREQQELLKQRHKDFLRKLMVSKTEELNFDARLSDVQKKIEDALHCILKERDVKAAETDYVADLYDQYHRRVSSRPGMKDHKQTYLVEIPQVTADDMQALVGHYLFTEDADKAAKAPQPYPTPRWPGYEDTPAGQTAGSKESLSSSSQKSAGSLKTGHSAKTVPPAASLKTGHSAKTVPPAASLKTGHSAKTVPPAASLKTGHSAKTVPPAASAGKAKVANIPPPKAASADAVPGHKATGSTPTSSLRFSKEQGVKEKLSPTAEQSASSSKDSGSQPSVSSAKPEGEVPSSLGSRQKQSETMASTSSIASSASAQGKKKARSRGRKKKAAGRKEEKESSRPVMITLLHEKSLPQKITGRCKQARGFAARPNGEMWVVYGDRDPHLDRVNEAGEVLESCRIGGNAMQAASFSQENVLLCQHSPFCQLQLLDAEKESRETIKLPLVPSGLGVGSTGIAVCGYRAVYWIPLDGGENEWIVEEKRSTMKVACSCDIMIIQGKEIVCVADSEGHKVWFFEKLDSGKFTPLPLFTHASHTDQGKTVPFSPVCLTSLAGSPFLAVLDGATHGVLMVDVVRNEVVSAIARKDLCNGIPSLISFALTNIGENPKLWVASDSKAMYLVPLAFLY